MLKSKINYKPSYNTEVRKIILKKEIIVLFNSTNLIQYYKNKKCVLLKFILYIHVEKLPCYKRINKSINWEYYN